jgi:hypothetical protein
MADPKVGMRYEDARSRIKRMTSNSHGNPQAKANICNSLVNQVRLHEGSKAARELVREFSR